MVLRSRWYGKERHADVRFASAFARRDVEFRKSHMCRETTIDPLLTPIFLSQGELESLKLMPLAGEGYLGTGWDAGSPGS